MTELIILIIVLIVVLYSIKLLKQKRNLHQNLEELKEENRKLEKGISAFHDKAASSINKIRNLKNESDLETFQETMLEMLIDLDFAEGGYLLENKNGKLELFSQKGDLEISDKILNLNAKDNTDAWEYLKRNEVIRLNDQDEKILDFILQEINDGYLITLKESQIDKKDIFSIIIIYGSQMTSTYLESDTLFMEFIVTELELMINNILKNKELEKSNKKLTEKLYNLMSLNFAAKMISSELEFKDIFKNSIDMFMEIGGAYSGAFMYSNEDKNQLIIKSIAGDLDKKYKNQEVKLSDETKKKLKNVKDIIIFNKDADMELSEVKNNEIIKNIKAKIYIPIFIKDSFLGAILLGEKQNEQPYSKDNIELLNTLSTQVGVSLNNARLYNSAIRDGMTKLYLNTYFKSRLASEIYRSRRYDSNLSLIMIDIDHFKNFNDTYGHQTGDKVLIEVANILKENTRSSDIVSRYGGEEFAIILPETGMDSSKIVAENIRKKVESKKIKDKSKILSVTISLGIFTLESGESEISGQEFIENADKTLYYSKENGRNQFNHYDDVKEKLDGKDS
ncbi:MAG: sensor domain-containing diguanylate cyclase [Fusobacteriota bacterium]